jgi:hypothetical protein
MAELESQIPEQQGEPESSQVSIDPEKLQAFIDDLESRQNLGMGIIGGLIGAAIGAVLWAVVTAVTGYQIGWMAVGVGALVGAGVRLLGKGYKTSFGIVGSVFALLGCLAGNLLTVCMMISQQPDGPRFVDMVLVALRPDVGFALFKDTFTPMDVLFYGIAVYEGYKLSFKSLTDEDLASLVSRQQQ